MIPPFRGPYRPDPDDSAPNPAQRILLSVRRGLDKVVKAGKALGGRSKGGGSGGAAGSGGGGAAGSGGEGAAGSAAGSGGRAAQQLGRLVTRKDFTKFKQEMLAAIRELKCAAEAQHKAQSSSAASLTEDNAKLKFMFERLSSDVKFAMEAEAAAGKLSREKFEELTRLINELTNTVGKTRLEKSAETKSLLSAIEAIMKTQSRHLALYTQLWNVSTIVAAIVALKVYLYPNITNRPGFFESIGEDTRDVIFEDYLNGCQLNIVPGFIDKLFVSMGHSVLNGVSTNDVFAKFSKANISAQILCTREGNVVGKLSMREICGPDVSFKLHLGYPANGNAQVQNVHPLLNWNGKFEIQSCHTYAGIRGSIGLTRDPLCYASVLLGRRKISLGGLIEYDTAQGEFRRFSIGGSFRNVISSLALTLDHLHEVTAALHHQCWDYTSIGAQLVHSLHTRRTRCSVGLEYKLDPSLVLKARASRDGMVGDVARVQVGAMAKIQITPKAGVAISADVDLRADVRQPPRLGLCVAYNANGI